MWRSRRDHWLLDSACVVEAAEREPPSRVLNWLAGTRHGPGGNFGIDRPGARLDPGPRMKCVASYQVRLELAAAGQLHGVAIGIAQLQALVLRRDLELHVVVAIAGAEKDLEHVAELPRALIQAGGAIEDVGVGQLGEHEQRVIVKAGSDHGRRETSLELLEP